MLCASFGNIRACCIIERKNNLKVKIIEIQNWPTPLNVKEIRGFNGPCVYVRIFIENFSQVLSPLRRLSREDVDWDWDQKCEEAFHQLRSILEEIILEKLYYDKEAEKIKLAVDSSSIAAGAVLTQEDKEGKDRQVFYGSITFSKLESKYSKPKLELCIVSRIFKKLKIILWEQTF
ncbi:hypothetical protein O181_036602 [Austropuccinia psidii MF-1]|uniref:Reverse transcriptase/retrotransposon-derived protein RNase H-like domain-containing protein n=1 Tax=Austropuccinia psidii MF-1 TaxID=1389203 RepID=A0A9Q3HA34_9BASI|nr:hypothetical protein [Austropuccinia psidii MF-1]